MPQSLVRLTPEPKFKLRTTFRDVESKVIIFAFKLILKAVTKGL